LAQHLISALRLDDRAPAVVPVYSGVRPMQPNYACRVRADHASTTRTSGPLVRAYMSPEP
jgi:hypothetical protein